MQLAAQMDNWMVVRLVAYSECLTVEMMDIRWAVLTAETLVAVMVHQSVDSMVDSTEAVMVEHSVDPTAHSTVENLADKSDQH